MRPSSACVIFFVASAITLPEATAAPCMVRGWDPLLLTPDEQTIPAAGGLLVGVKSGGGDSGPGPSGNANPALTELSLSRNGKLVKLVGEALAPGLARYRPAKPVAGKWTVVGLEPKRVTEFAAIELAPLPAPLLSAVARHATKMKRRRIITTDHLTATLVGPRPEAAIGLVVYAGSADAGAALLAQTAPGTTVHLYSSPDRCQSEVPKRRLPAVGDSVRLAWFDALGRLSPRSAPIEVTERAGLGGPADLTPAPTTNPAPKEEVPEKKPPSKSQSDDGCQIAGESSAAPLLLALLLVCLRRRQMTGQ